MDGVYFEMVNYVSSFPFAKAIYSILLVSIVLLGISELHRVWFDRTLEVQVFKFMQDRVPKDEEGTAFTWGLIERHASLRERFRRAEEADIEAEAKYKIEDDSPIRGTDNVLSELNITVSQFNVSAFLDYLRKWVSTPQELRGLVTGQGDVFNVSADIRGGKRTLANGQDASSSVRLINLKTTEDAVFQTACHLIWLSAARKQKEIADIGRDEFCLWTKYWQDFLDTKDQALRVGALSEDNVSKLEKLIADASGQIRRPAKYIRFRDLRADIQDFMAQWENDPSKKQTLRLAAQRDHFDYLKNLNADLREGADLSELKKSRHYLYILAAMRPALPVGDDYSFDYGALEQTDKLLVSGGFAKFWKYALENAYSVKVAARSMGLASLGKQGIDKAHSPIPCFAIAKNLVAAAGFSFNPDVFDVDIPPPYWFDVPQGSAKFRFATSESVPKKDEGKVLGIKRVLVLGGGASDLVLFELDGHDDLANPPIALDSSGTEAEVDGEFIAVLGYPVADPRFPEAFTKALLGDKERVLRVMPGRSTLGEASRTLEELRLRFEASTTGGTAGGPVIGLHSGKLVGISMAGEFDENEMLKRGFALRVSDIVTREPFKSVLAAQPNPLDITFQALAGQVKKIVPGEETADEPDDTEDPGGARAGYDSGFLSGHNIPMPRLSDATPLTILDYTHFSVAMHKENRMAAIAAANIDGSQFVNIERDTAERFILDARVPSSEQLDNNFYRGLRDIERGTLLRRLYVAWGPDAKTAVRDWYFLPGVVPQHRLLNQRSWSDLERYVYDYISLNKKRAVVFAGPVFSEDDPIFEGIRLPQRFWKILVVDEDGILKVAAYLLAQQIDAKASDETHISAEVPPFDPKISRTSVSQVSQLTNIDFGVLLNAAEIE